MKTKKVKSFSLDLVIIGKLQAISERDKISLSSAANKVLKTYFKIK